MKSFKQFFNSNRAGCIHHLSFESTFVKAIFYNFDNHSLYITLKSKEEKQHIKLFYNVHPNTILKFIEARSKGEFYRKSIEKNYKSEAIDFNWYCSFLESRYKCSFNIYSICDIKRQYKGYIELRKVLNASNKCIN